MTRDLMVSSDPGSTARVRTAADEAAPPGGEQHATALRDVLAEVARSWPLILAVMVVCLGVGAAAGLLRPSSYATQAKVLFVPTTRQDVPVLEGSSLVSNQIGTYAALAETPAVLDPAVQAADVPAAMAVDVSAAPVPSTSIITIAVSGADPQQVARLADAVGTSLIEQVEDTSSSGGGPLVTGTIVERPLVPGAPEGPGLVLYFAVAFAVGSALSLLAVVLRRALAVPRREG